MCVGHDIALENRPLSPSLSKRLSILFNYSQSGDYFNAMVEANSIIQSEENASNWADGYYYYAKCIINYIRSGERVTQTDISKDYQQNLISSAIESYQQAIWYDAELIPAHYELGLLFLSIDRPEEAIAHFGQVIYLEPRNIEGYISLATAYQGAGLIQEALSTWYRAVEIDGLNIQIKIKLGNAFLIAGNEKAAYNYFNVLLKESYVVSSAYNTALVNIAIGDSLVQAKMISQALTYYQAAILEMGNGGSSTLNFKIGSVLQKQAISNWLIGRYARNKIHSSNNENTFDSFDDNNRLEEGGNEEYEILMRSMDALLSDSELYFEASFLLDPLHFETRLKLARFSLAKNNFERAFEHAKYSLTLNPKSSEAHFLTASSCHTNISQALEHFQQSVWLSNTCAECYLGLGISFLKLLKYHRAADAFQQAAILDHFPFSFKARLLWGIVALNIDQPLAAIVHIESLIKVIDEEEEQIGDTLYYSDNLLQEELKPFASYSGLIYYNLAIAYYNLGEISKSLEYCDLAVISVPSFESYTLMSFVLSVSGQLQASQLYDNTAKQMLLNENSLDDFTKLVFVFSPKITNANSQKGEMDLSNNIIFSVNNSFLNQTSFNSSAFPSDSSSWHNVFVETFRFFKDLVTENSPIINKMPESNMDMVENLIPFPQNQCSFNNEVFSCSTSSRVNIETVKQKKNVTGNTNDLDYAFSFIDDVRNECSDAIAAGVGPLRLLQIAQSLESSACMYSKVCLEGAVLLSSSNSLTAVAYYDLAFLEKIKPTRDGLEDEYLISAASSVYESLRSNVQLLFPVIEKEIDDLSEGKIAITDILTNGAISGFKLKGKQLFLARNFMLIVIDLEPSSLELQQLMGGILFELGEYHSALHHFSICENLLVDIYYKSVEKKLPTESLHVIANKVAEVMTICGKIFEASHLNQKAADKYIKALQYNPVYEESIYNLGMLLENDGQFSVAAGFYHELVRFDLKNVKATLAYGKALWQAGRIAESVSAYENFFEYGTIDAFVEERMIAGLRLQGRIDDALKHALILHQFLTIRSHNEIDMSLMLVEHLKNEVREKVKVDNVIKIIKDSLLNGEKDDARDLALFIVSACASSPPHSSYSKDDHFKNTYGIIECPQSMCTTTFLKLGEIFLNVSESQIASDFYTSALASSPPAPDKFILALGKAFEFSGSTSAAVRAYESIINTESLRPKEKPFVYENQQDAIQSIVDSKRMASLYLARLLRFNKQYTAALVQYKSIISMKMENMNNILYEMSTVLIELEDYEEAAIHLYSVLDLFKEDDIISEQDNLLLHNIYVAIGTIKNRQKKNVEAITLFEKSLSFNPQSIVALEQLSYLLYNKNDIFLALKYLREIMKLKDNHNFDIDINNELYYIYASSCFQLAEYTDKSTKEKKDLYTEGIKALNVFIDPTTIKNSSLERSLNLLGYASFQIEDYFNAFHFFDRLIKINSNAVIESNRAASIFMLPIEMTVGIENKYMNKCIQNKDKECRIETRLNVILHHIDNSKAGDVIVFTQSLEQIVSSLKDYEFISNKILVQIMKIYMKLSMLLRDGENIPLENIISFLKNMIQTVTNVFNKQNEMSSIHRLAYDEKEINETKDFISLFHSYMSVLLSLNNEHSNAVSMLEVALVNMDPRAKTKETFYKLKSAAFILFRAGKITESRAFYKLATKHETSNSDLFFNLAVCNYMLQSNEDALNFLKIAYNLEKNERNRNGLLLLSGDNKDSLPSSFRMEIVQNNINPVIDIVHILIKDKSI